MTTGAPLVPGSSAQYTVPGGSPGTSSGIGTPLAWGMRRMVRATAAAALASSSRILSTTVCGTRTSESSSLGAVSAASVLTLPRLCRPAPGVDGARVIPGTRAGLRLPAARARTGPGRIRRPLPRFAPDVNGQLKPARCLAGGLAGLDGLVPSLARLPGKPGER